MAQKQKDLLLKDLCARLPYGVKVQTTFINKETKERKDIGTNILGTVEISLLIEGYEEHKPYLFPLSSMTEEHKSQYSFFLTRIIDGYDSSLLIDWFNKNHFDYRGLIERGLAIDATGLNIY